MLKVYAARVGLTVACRENTFYRERTHSVGLTVAPESGAYTVACIDPLTFQEELQYYIAVKD